MQIDYCVCSVLYKHLSEGKHFDNCEKIKQDVTFYDDIMFVGDSGQQQAHELKDRGEIQPRQLNCSYCSMKRCTSIVKGLWKFLCVFCQTLSKSESAPAYKR